MHTSFQGLLGCTLLGEAHPEPRHTKRVMGLLGKGRSTEWLCRRRKVPRGGERVERGRFFW